MSSLVCNSTQCVFTRVDTNGTAAVAYPPPVIYPPISMYPTPTPVDLVNYTTTAPWTDEVNQDILSNTTALTRDFSGGLFNAKVPDDLYNYLAPSNTEWAMLPEGKTFEEARCSLTFCSWNDCFTYGSPEYYILGKPAIVHLIEEDVYYNIMFTNWTSDNPYPCNANYCPGPYINRRMEGNGNEVGDRHRRTQGDVVVGTSNSTTSAVAYPVYPPPYPSNGRGGGLSYVRDAKPFTVSPNLPECPKCYSAVADPAVLKGPADDSFVNVTIGGVTPTTAKIVIKAVSQDQTLKCNVPISNGLVRPNAKFETGGSVAQLRRTRTAGELNTFRYTIYFDAVTDGGTCSGQVSACVPGVEGFDCDTTYGFDATAVKYCNY
jgi:hypothetical protein